MKHLYFIRHGQSVMNVSGHIAGSTDTPLTDEGREQARTTGKQMKTDKIKVDIIIASPLSRAHETAKLVAEEIGYPVDKIHTNPLLTERHFGELEGKPWSPDLNMDGFSDLETDDTLIERAHLAFKWLKNLPEENVLVVSHGAFGRALRSITLHDFPMDHSHRIGNAELIKLI